jgi:hypothetical protein
MIFKKKKSNKKRKNAGMWITRDELPTFLLMTIITTIINE